MLKITKIFVLACLLLCLISCDNNVSKEYYSFTDDLGNKISLENKPNNVAVLFSSFVDIWNIAGGKTSITVGESIERGFVNDDVILVDKGAGKTINTELLVAANPDFVICSSDIEAQVKTAKILNDANIPSACFRVEKFEDYLNMLNICTDITGNKEAYTEFGLNVKKEIDDIFENLSTPVVKDILFIRAGSTSSSTKAKLASQHFVADMLEELGTYNIADDAKILLDGLSIEHILLADPDYIFISTMGDEEASKENIETLFASETYQALTAVREKKYVFLPKDMFQFKPNAKWAEAYRYLVDIIYEK